MPTLIWLIASPFYFIISLSAGADPLTGLFCAWIGVMTTTCITRALLSKRSMGPALPVNVSLDEVPRRFTVSNPAGLAGV